MKRKPPAPKPGFITGNKVLYTQSHLSRNARPSRRVFSQGMVLDAPDLRYAFIFFFYHVLTFLLSDDYYLNLLDWSHVNDHLAVAIGHLVRF